MAANQSKSAKQVLAEFRGILKEASQLFNRPMSDINYDQFSVAGAGRLGAMSMMKCGGFIKLRDYVAPKNNKAKKETVEMIERMLRHG